MKMITMLSIIGIAILCFILVYFLVSSKGIKPYELGQAVWVGDEIFIIEESSAYGKYIRGDKWKIDYVEYVVCPQKKSGTCKTLWHDDIKLAEPTFLPADEYTGMRRIEKPTFAPGSVQAGFTTDENGVERFIIDGEYADRALIERICRTSVSE